MFFLSYRASHILLDYLQVLTPKLIPNTQKTANFPQENILILAYSIFKNDHFFLNFRISPKNCNLDRLTI